MRIQETKIYKFDELSDEAKEKARDWYREGAFDHEWWDSVYEDASGVCLKITGFDLGRASKCNIEYTQDACATADAIKREHGETCETHKDATKFLAERDKLVDEAEKDESGEFVDEYGLDQKLDEIEAEFLHTLSEDYRIMLEKEFEYLTSDEAVEESILANEHEFTEDGASV